MTATKNFLHSPLKDERSFYTLNLFGKRKKSDSIPAVQTAPAISTQNHPYDLLHHCGKNFSNQWRLYHTLREAVPIIDAAISKIVRLTGEFRIECENPEIQYRINKFLNNVQVNACDMGANSFMLSYLDQLLTYGTAIGEIVVDSTGSDIAALYNAPLKSIELRSDESPLSLKIFKKNPNGQLSEIKYPELVLVSSLSPEPGNIYGNSLLRGLPFVSDILLKIYNSIGLNWERVGNVRFAVTYKPSGDAGEKAFTRERASQIASEWSKAMKSTSNPSDFIAIGDVNIKVIGADNQVLDSQVPVKQMLEQIVSKLSIPPFLLGLNWSTTETMSTQQAEILGNELAAYRRMLNPIITKICNTWFMLNGIYAEYRINWNTIDLKDQLQIANTRLTNAKALEIEQKINDRDKLQQTEIF